MPSFIGPWEIVLLLLVVLIFFGPKRLPEMGRSLGKGMREFKDSITGKDEDEPVHTELPAAPPAPVEPIAASEQPAEPVTTSERDPVS